MGNLNDLPRSGISLDRALRIQADLLNAIQEIYGQASAFKFTNDDISEKINQVFNCEKAKKAPQHVISFLRGYCQARRDEMYRYHIAWVMSCDGKLMTSDEINQLTRQEQEAGNTKDFDYRSPWSRIDSDLSRHVWKDAKGEPLRDKPYDRRFIGK